MRPISVSVCPLAFPSRRNDGVEIVNVVRGDAAPQSIQPPQAGQLMKWSASFVAGCPTRLPMYRSHAVEPDPRFNVEKARGVPPTCKNPASAGPFLKGFTSRRE